LNKKAVSSGVVSSAEMANFRRTNDIRMKARVDDALSAHSSWPAALATMTFGRPSRPSTPIHAVICNAYQRSWIEEQRQRSASAGANGASGNKANRSIGRFGSSAHTRASLGHMKVEAPAAPQPFKMKRFANVQSKLAQAATAPTRRTQGALVASTDNVQAAPGPEQGASVFSAAGQMVADQAPDQY
jgi:hypothetical protein